MTARKNKNGITSMKTNRLAPTAWLGALILAGCAAPAFQPPQLDVPAAFKEQPVPAASAEEAARWKPAQPAEAQPRGEWWKVFGDARLDALIAQATQANPGLAAAAARLKQARAIAGITQAEQVPTVDAGFGVERSRASAAARGLPEGTPVQPGTVWQGRLSASYEVDLFGRIDSAVNAAEADAAASEALHRSVLLALQADVVQTWFRLRATDAELALLRETIGTREESVRITQRRFEVGDVGELDVVRARTELATTRAQAHALERERSRLEHALAVLLGRPASAFDAPPDPLAEPAVLPAIPAGLPSALLERRPDISAAQHAMMAANARIGAARAAMFPALRLTAAGGGESAELADLFEWSSRSWVLGALMSLPVIDGGRNRNNVLRSEAALEEAVAGYRQTVLAAFAEVEDNLSALRTLAQQAAAIEDALASARRSAELADKLYAAGRSGYLEVLDAQRNLQAVQRDAVQLRGARAVATVALVRSLGGAW